MHRLLFLASYVMLCFARNARIAPFCLDEAERLTVDDFAWGAALPLSDKSGATMYASHSGAYIAKSLERGHHTWLVKARETLCTHWAASAAAGTPSHIVRIVALIQYRNRQYVVMPDLRASLGNDTCVVDIKSVSGLLRASRYRAKHHPHACHMHARAREVVDTTRLDDDLNILLTLQSTDYSLFVVTNQRGDVALGIGDIAGKGYARLEAWSPAISWLFRHFQSYTDPQYLSDFVEALHAWSADIR